MIPHAEIARVSRKANGLQFFHIRVGEVLWKLLDNQQKRACKDAIEVTYRTKVTDTIGGADYATQLVNLLENPSSKLINGLRNWFKSAVIARSGSTVFTAPLAWYLYGHYWWDEFDRSFEYCDNIIRFVDENAELYEELGVASEHAMFIREVEEFRDNWHRGHSIWALRRAVDVPARQEDVKYWEESYDLVNVLRVYVKDIPSLEDDMANVILDLCKAECLWGMIDMEPARDLFIKGVEDLSKLSIYDWAVPYALVDLADVYIDMNDLDSALSTLRRAINHKSCKSDDYAYSEIMRCFGDYLWEAQETKFSIDAYLLSIYHAMMAHKKMSLVTDAYGHKFHHETNWSLKNRIMECSHSISISSEEISRYCSDFWDAYATPSNGTSYVVAPNPPEIGFDFDAKELEEKMQGRIAEIKKPLVKLLSMSRRQN